MTNCVIVSDTEQWEAYGSFVRVPCVGETLEPMPDAPGDWPEGATGIFWTVTAVCWTLTGSGSRPMLTVERAESDAS